MIALIAVSRLIPLKGNCRIMKNINKISAQKTACASWFLQGLVNPSIRKHSYEEQTNGKKIKI
jgi:hypothetical protein